MRFSDEKVYRMRLTKENAFRGEASKLGSINLQHLGDGIEKAEERGGTYDAGPDRWGGEDTAICYTSGSATRRLI